MSLGVNAISLAERLVDPLGPIEGVPGGQINPTPQSIARILDPGNSRENQLDFFSLDHEK